MIDHSQLIVFDCRNILYIRVLTHTYSKPALIVVIFELVRSFVRKYGCIHIIYT